MALISFASVSFTSPLINKSQFCGSFSVGIGSARKNRGVKFCRAAASSSAVVFPRLDADDFRHPLDKQAGPLIFFLIIILCVLCYCLCFLTSLL